MKKDEAALKAFFAFAHALRSFVQTFAEFNRIVRETINHKSFGMTDEELSVAITNIGGDLE